MPGGGGLMQLIAYGAQDVYLTGPPCCSICSKKIENGWFGKDKYYHQKCKDDVIKNLDTYLYGDLVGVIVKQLIDDG